MTREEAIRQLDGADIAVLNRDFFKFNQAIIMAISAIRQEEHFREVTKKVEPLTMDELREMPIRDWVWIEILNPDAFRSKETVSAYYRKYDGYKKDEIFWCGYPGLGFGFDYDDYGKTWLAYRQKPEEVQTEDVAPVRHGRWEQCKYMLKTAKCSECGCYYTRFTVHERYPKYCPYCGCKMEGDG